jgi:hypothetical protein
MAEPTELTLKLYFSHQDCTNAEAYRTAGGHGFPRLLPVLHERYNPNRTYLKCEACGTVISHSLVNATETESS